MKDEPNKNSHKRSLDERFAQHPQMYERLQQIGEQMEEMIARGVSADDAEEIAIKQIRELGQAWLTDWAKAQHERSVAQVKKEIPSAIKNVKKN